MLLEEIVPTYQGTSCMLLEEELQRIRNIWQVSYRICYIVAGTFCKFLVCAQEHERYYPTPPHPTGSWSWKSSAVPVSAGQQEKWWGCCACVCAQEHERYYPTPPHPTPLETWMRDDQGAQVSDILLVGAQVRGWPKGTPCPSPVSPSVTLKVWFSGALSDPLFWCSKWSHGALSDPLSGALSDPLTSLDLDVHRKFPASHIWLPDIPIIIPT